MSARRPSGTNEDAGPRLSARCAVRAGEIVGGKYSVERLIGEGGMGVVVAARHLRLGQRVAIKFLSEEVAGDAVVVGRFVHEARAVAPLRSEHVVRVHDVSSQNVAAPYMVMEYLEGHDLAQLVDKEGPLAIADAVDYLLEACEGVAEAHAAGIVHRDLKPSNLFLARSPDGSAVVKVLDFGISKAMNQPGRPAFTTTTDLIGTPAYMSPEQLRSSRDIDARTDVWALGLILYELLTGRAAFEADTMPQLCSKILAEEPPSPAEHRPDLPPELVDVILKCVRKSTAERFADCGALASALVPFGGGAAAASAAKVLRVLSASRRSSTEPPPLEEESDANVVDLVGGRAPTVASWGTGAVRANATRRRGLTIAVVGALLGVAGGVAAVVVARGTREESTPASRSPSPSTPVAASSTPEPSAMALAPPSPSAPPAPPPSASASAQKKYPLRPAPASVSPKPAGPAVDPDSQFGGRK